MLGCIIFNMVTGVPPFFSDETKDSDAELNLRIREGSWREKLSSYV